MGQVYLARQLDLGRQVVVKVMHDHIAADLELRLQKADAVRDNLLRITVILSPTEKKGASGDWRDRCGRIYCDQDGYLMGQTNS